jgi:hypothetical protein
VKNILSELDFAGALPVRPCSPLEQPSASDDEREFVRELYETLERTAAPIVDAIESLAVQCRTVPQEFVHRYGANQEFQNLLAVADSLPPAAFSGHLKLKDVVPTAVNRQAATAFAAYLVVATMRIIFFGERRGIDNLRSAADARREKHQSVLAPHLLQLLDGFGSIRSMLDNPRIDQALQSLCDCVWAVFPETERALVAAGLSYDLLVSCGTAWRSK